MLTPGKHKIGPANGRLTLRTFREGMAAVVGHDLVIGITRRQGTVSVPEGPGDQPHLAVEIDMGSFEVRVGEGGVKPLTDGDRQEIKGQIAETLRTSDNERASFESRTVRIQGETRDAPRLGRARGGWRDVLPLTGRDEEREPW